MPYRKTIFANNEVYHVYSRGVFHNQIFYTKRDYLRALETINFYQYFRPKLKFSHYKQLSIEDQKIFQDSLLRNHPRIVEILAFCLMPNHFHFLLKQQSKQGVSLFVSNFQNSYAHYFNTKRKRKGPFFEPMFKAVRIENDEQLLHVVRYIHLNPYSSYLISKIERLENYPWSSSREYITYHNYGFTSTDLIKKFFKNKEQFRDFHSNQADYQKNLQRIKKLLVDTHAPSLTAFA